MKVINLITHMEAGGAQANAIRMSQQMRKRGIDAETWFIYKKFDTYINEPNVSIIHDAPPTNIFHALKIFFKIIKLLRKHKLDGVITYSHYSNVLGSIAAKFSGIKKRVSTLQNPVSAYPKSARIIDRLLGPTGFYTSIIAVSETVKKSCDLYPESYKKRIHVIYNGVPKRLSSLTKEEARKKFNLNISDNRLLINVGRLHPQKNQQLLINLMPLLTGYHLAIAGDGMLRDKLTTLASNLNVLDRVHFMGELLPGDIPDFFKCGDMFVFPSIYEGFGLAIFEAAYNGLPTVASNIPSSIEVLTTKNNKKAGLIVETMQTEDWAKAITSLNDKDLREDLILNMQQQLNQFNIGVMVESYIQQVT